MGREAFAQANGVEAGGGGSSPAKLDDACARRIQRGKEQSEKNRGQAFFPSSSEPDREVAKDLDALQKISLLVSRAERRSLVLDRLKFAAERICPER